MEVRAITKYLRISPKKMRLVINVVRGMGVLQAENQLHFITRRASVDIIKTLRSAIANAENNFNLKKENLFIKRIVVNEGPSLKRWTPKAFGRASPIKKRSSHLEIVLDEYRPTLKIAKKEVVKNMNADRSSESSTTTVHQGNQGEDSSDQKKALPKTVLARSRDKKSLKPRKMMGGLKKIFTRKAI